MDTAPFEDLSECQTLDALLHQKIVYLQLLQGVVVAANEALTIAEATQRCLDQVCAHTGWPIGLAYLPAEDVTGILMPRTFWHLDDPGRFTPFQAIIEGTCLTPGVGLVEQVLASGTPAWIGDVTEAPHVPWAKHAPDVGIKAGFAFPVLVEAKVSAVLEFFSTETGEPAAALLDVMAHMGTQLGRVIERRRAEETRAPLAAILESSDDAIIGTTLDGTLVDWNTGAERMYGYRRDEVNGRPIAILDLNQSAMSREELRRYVRDTLRLETYFQQRFSTVVQPSADEILRYYREHAAESTVAGTLQPLDAAREAARTAVIREQREVLLRQWVDGLRRRGAVQVAVSGEIATRTAIRSIIFSAARIVACERRIPNREPRTRATPATRISPAAPG